MNSSDKKEKKWPRCLSFKCWIYDTCLSKFKCETKKDNSID